MNYLHLLYFVAVSATLVAAFTDFRTGLIPNWLTLPALALGVAAHVLGSGWHGALFSVLGVLICGATPLLFHRLGAMGGGDVKLFAALGALVGPGMGLEIELLSLSVAFGFGLMAMAWRGTLWRTLKQAARVFVNAIVPRAHRRELAAEQLTSLRIGAAIFAGCCLAVIDHAFLGGLVP